MTSDLFSWATKCPHKFLWKEYAPSEAKSYLQELTRETKINKAQASCWNMFPFIINKLTSYIQSFFASNQCIVMVLHHLFSVGCQLETSFQDLKLLKYGISF